MNINVPYLINFLNNIKNDEERYAAFILFICTTPNDYYFINIRTRKSVFENLPYINKSIQSINKLYMFRIILGVLNYIKCSEGLITNKALTQLCSDFTYQEINLITYHLYKPHLSVDNVMALSNCINTPILQISSAVQSKVPVDVTKLRDVSIFACNEAFTIFYDSSLIKYKLLPNAKNKIALKKQIKQKFIVIKNNLQIDKIKITAQNKKELNNLKFICRNKFDTIKVSVNKNNTILNIVK
ncbi:hypothetical protein MrNuV_ORF044 [Macrobrachium rosenbergii nudivirus]|nr:hypothetical protein MrNuV_ORF044 [Macrobrachium rosenbergii nudivirus]